MSGRPSASQFSPAAIHRRAEAMRIRRRRAHHSRGLAATLNLPAMIDLTFLFLIFFLVTTTFERAEGILASDMPKSRGQSGVALPVSPIVIRLSPGESDPDGFSISIDRFDNVPKTFGGLTDFLRGVQKEPGFDNETPIVIVASDDVQWDHVVGCWNAALRAGCKTIAFAEP
jgi:biopolymer transport protein ExbD